MTDQCGRTKRDGSGDACELPAGWGTDHPGEGACKHHGGASSGAPEGNDNAVTVEAWSENFVEDFLTEAEQDLVDDARKLLDDDATAQELGSTAAAIALVQFRRTGDQRFLHRFESICDTFEIAPEDVQRHEHVGGDGDAIQFDVTRTVVSTDEHEHE